MKTALQLAGDLSQFAHVFPEGCAAFEVFPASKLIESRDAEIHALYAPVVERVKELEAELDVLKGGMNHRSMPLNNRSLRMK